MEDDDNAFQLFAPGANKRKRTQAVVSENGKGKHGAPTPATAAGLQPGSNINTDDKLKKKKKIKQLEPGSDGQDADATVAADGQQEEVVSEDMPERAQGEVSTSAAKTFKGLGLTEWLEGVLWDQINV